MSVIGYARVSTTDQTLDVQLAQLNDAGCETVFSEQESALKENRPELLRCVEFCREGDVLLVTRLDRLARSIVHLRTIISALDAKGVGFRCLSQEIDTTSSSGRLLLNILGSFAEFEMDIRRERQAEGIQAAKAAGKYKGKANRRDVTAAEIRALRAEGLGASAIAKKLKIGRKTIYKKVTDGWGASPFARGDAEQTT